MSPAELRPASSSLRRMESWPHHHTPVGQLSARQIKRVILGAELLRPPSLLFIDEADERRDPAPRRLIMHLSASWPYECLSLCGITHTSRTDHATLALIWRAASLIYYGPAARGPEVGFFSFRGSATSYDRIADWRDVAEWERDFAKSDLYREVSSGDRLAARPIPFHPRPRAATGGGESRRSLLPPLFGAVEQAVPPRRSRFRQIGRGHAPVARGSAAILDSWNQFLVLTARDVELTLASRRSLKAAVSWQAPPRRADPCLLASSGKPFNRPMPLLRPLDDEERRTLQSRCAA